MSTLASRLIEAIESAQSRGYSISDIAARCGITVQSVYQWMQAGERKSIDGANLAELCDMSGFTALYLSKNKGPKMQSAAEGHAVTSVPEILQAIKQLGQKDQEKIRIELDYMARLAALDDPPNIPLKLPRSA